MFIILFLLILELGDISLEFGVSLLSELGLKHEAALCCLVEEVGTVSQTIVAELLRDALGIGSLRAFLDEVV